MTFALRLDPLFLVLMDRKLHSGRVAAAKVSRMTLTQKKVSMILYVDGLSLCLRLLDPRCHCRYGRDGGADGVEGRVLTDGFRLEQTRSDLIAQQGEQRDVDEAGDITTGEVGRAGRGLTVV